MIGVVMGSSDDYEFMKHACWTLRDFGIAYESKVISAHRTPDLLYKYAKEARDNGLQAIIAGAGGAAHLPGMLASLTTVAVLGVAIGKGGSAFDSMDSLLSISRMPRGIPVATFSSNYVGATNAALFVVAMLSNASLDLRRKLEAYRAKQTQNVLEEKLI